MSQLIRSCFFCLSMLWTCVAADEGCHAESSSCTCCGVTSPTETVMQLVEKVAGENYRADAPKVQRLRWQLEALFDETGADPCPPCAIRQTVVGILESDDRCCDRGPQRRISESIPLTSDEGRSILRASRYQRDLLPLLQQFEVQQEGWWCAVATATMLLNALPIDRAESKYADYRLFTQERFFEDPTCKSLGLTPGNKAGICLSQLQQVLDNKSQVSSVMHEMKEPDVALFRERVKEVLQDPRAYLLVNYSRSVADQGQGAHFSPIAAYNEDADAVLILDTAKFKYAPFWMPIELAVRAMNTPDSKNPDVFRGFLIVSAQ